MKEMNKKDKKEDMMKEKQYLLLLIEKEVGELLFGLMEENLLGMSIGELTEMLERLYDMGIENDVEEEPESCECEKDNEELKDEIRRLRNRNEELENIIKLQQNCNEELAKEVNNKIELSINAMERLQKAGFSRKNADILATQIILSVLVK